ncbi:uncharacterized protein [Arachis hypogaea]|uniref:uncharacterized protein n=1 Tax=Arachis hypogaea TaxID=3818 RepID=UPI000DEC3055|nr:uncharacterized protein LOC112729873 [Arachis hypogaea]
MANQNWITDKLEKRLLTQLHLTHREVFDHIKIDFNVVCSDKMIYRVLSVARERYIGNERAQYGKLRDYLTKIHESNPGGSALLELIPTILDSPPLFSKLYVCLEACKRGFKTSCRPLIGLDGCHLKGYYGGQLLSAVGQDANNHFYVIAYTGLLPALQEVMPNAHHRNCRLKRMNEGAWAYLAKFQPSCWTKAHFNHWPKLDNVTNNMTEVWNAKINHYRGKPILTMLEEIRYYLMRRMAKHKKVLSTYIGRHSKKVGVHLGRHTCSCNLWQLTGIPCVHVLTAIQKRCNRPEPYVHPWLKMDAFRATYEHVIRPINSEKYWKKIGLLAPEPSTIKKPPGRPTKKKRKPDPVEDARDATKERRTFMVTCQKCGQSDHNAKTCNGPPRPKSPPNVKENKQPRAKKNTSSAPPLQDEVQVSQTAPQSLPQEHTTNMSSGAVTTSVSRPPRPKQPIRRPHPTPTPTPTIYSSTFSRSHHLRTTTEAYPISIT